MKTGRMVLGLSASTAIAEAASIYLRQANDIHLTW